MAIKYPGPCKLRDTPATDLELYRIKRARETGKVKNPTWYKVPKLPEPFKPDFRQFFPAHCRPNPISAPVLTIPQGEFKTTAEYVAAFEKANSLLTPERAREIAAERRERELQERNAAKKSRAVRRSQSELAKGRIAFLDREIQAGN